MIDFTITLNLLGQCSKMPNSEICQTQKSSYYLHLNGKMVKWYICKAVIII